MKKLILTILTLAIAVILSFTIFAGCSQVSQLNKLQAPWANYERFTYDVHIEGDTEPVGEMIMTFNRVVNSTKTINNADYTFNGSYFEMQLNITRGEGNGDSIYSQVAFKTDFTPIASYKETNFGGDITSSYIRYNTSKNAGKISINGGEDISFKHKGAFYDNEMMYLLVRASDLSESNYSMNFSSPNNLEGDKNSISVARSGAITVTTEVGEIECNNYTLTAAADYGSGVSMIVSIAKSSLIVEDNSVVKPIIRIREGAYTYTLNSISFDLPEQTD